MKQTRKHMQICIVLLMAVAGFIKPAHGQSPHANPCTGFESLPLGTTYFVGDTFSDAGDTITVHEFQWYNGIWSAGGHAAVENAGQAGGIGQEMNVNNINLAFDFGSPIDGLSLYFGEYGGNLNIEINGEFVNFADFAELEGLVIGGAEVATFNGFGNDKGAIKLIGYIESFVIGGQELYIDNVCSGPSKSHTRAKTAHFGL